MGLFVRRIDAYMQIALFLGTTLKYISHYPLWHSSRSLALGVSAIIGWSEVSFFFRRRWLWSWYDSRQWLCGLSRGRLG